MPSVLLHTELPSSAAVSVSDLLHPHDAPAVHVPQQALMDSDPNSCMHALMPHAQLVHHHGDHAYGWAVCIALKRYPSVSP